LIIGLKSSLGFTQGTEILVRLHQALGALQADRVAAVDVQLGLPQSILIIIELIIANLAVKILHYKNQNLLFNLNCNKI
jgi:hypothetical protein